MRIVTQWSEYKKTPQEFYHEEEDALTMSPETHEPLTLTWTSDDTAKTGTSSVLDYFKAKHKRKLPYRSGEEY